MNRKIKFRGKRIDNNEWVYGGILIYPESGDVYIQEYGVNYKGEEYARSVRVIPETIGQMTPSKDKNDKEIYEGDVLTSKSKKKFVCKWDGAGFKLDSGRNRHWSTSSTGSLVVMGNIHEKETV